MSLNLPVASFKTSITSRISATATEIPFDSIVDDAGDNLSGTKGFVIDEGTVDEEFVIGTIDAPNSQIITCLRGVSPTDGSTEVATLQKAHRKRAVIKISSHPYLLLALRVLNGTDAMGGVMKLPSSRTISDQRHVTDKEYVDTVAAAAGGIADLTVSANGALTIDVNSGQFMVGTYPSTYAGASAQAVTDNATNYVQLKYDGTLSINTSGWTDGYIALATVVASGGAITSITDMRPFFTQPTSVMPMYAYHTYGESITFGDPVYVAVADGKVYKAKATTATLADGFYGVALETGAADAYPMRVQIGGLFTYLSGLTINAPVYLTDAGGFSSTAGTYRKVVGWAIAAGEVLIQSGHRVEDLSGGNSNYTTTNMDLAMGYFATPYNQPIRRSVTAAENLLAGEAVAIGTSGGELTNMTGWDSQGTAVTTNDDITGNSMMAVPGVVNGSSSYFVICGSSGAQNTRIFRVQYTASTGAIGTVTVKDLSEGDAGATNTYPMNHGIQLASDKVLIAYMFGAATYTIRAKIYTPSSDAEGTEVLVATPGSGQHQMFTIMPVSATECVVLYTDASGLKYVRLTISGTTITVGTAGTVLTDADLNGVTSAKQFGSSGYYLITLHTNSTNVVSYLICAYSAGVFSGVSAKATLSATTTTVTVHSSELESLSDTKMLCVARLSSTIRGFIFTRTDGAVAVDSGTSILTGLDTGEALGYAKLGDKTFVVLGKPTGSVSVTYGQLFKVKNAFVDIETLGSTVQLDGSSVSMPDTTGCAIKILPHMLIVGFPYYNGASQALRIAPYTMTTNYEKYVGVCESDTVAGASASLIVSGTTDEMSGLTAGSAYYTDVSGDVTATNTGYTTNAIRRVGVADTTTSMIVK